MVGLTTQNFVSAATGAAVAIALFRGIARQQTTHLGNFWRDLVRFCLYVLLPMALIQRCCWSGGVPQSLSAYLPFHALEGQGSCCRSARPPPRSPSSSSAPSGGGFFGINSAHPFENPTALSNWLEMVAPADAGRRHGLHPGALREGSGHSRAILIAMTIMLVLGLCPRHRPGS